MLQLTSPRDVKDAVPYDKVRTDLGDSYRWLITPPRDVGDVRSMQIF